MTEKEMIEEMAKDIPFLTLDREVFVGATEKKKVGWTLSEEDNKVIAESLIKQNYRKLPKGSVVLTSEQYSNYLILQTNEEWLKNKATELQTDNERLYKNLGKFKEQVRKETAKAFAKELRNFIYLCDDIEIDCNTYEKISNKIDEIAKQFGVEVQGE